MGGCRGVRPGEMLLFLLSCAKPTEVTPPPKAPDETPVLPAPEAPLYAAVRAEPADPLVARVIGGDDWDESLSGAAGAMAMQGEEPDLRMARWAAYRAGYPHPVVIAVVGDVPAGQEPLGFVQQVREAMRPGDDLGLARARVRNEDWWVALVGRPSARLEPFPREVEAGGAIDIVANQPVSWTVVAPTGELRSGNAPAAITLDHEGEWWLEVRRPDGALVASIPVYAQMSIPPEPLVLPGQPVAGPAEAQQRLMSLFNDVRQAFDVTEVRPDATLQTLAEWPLEQLASGNWLRASAEKRLHAAGFVGGPVGQLVCSDDSVEECVAGWLSDPQDRARLLEPGFRVGGAAAQVSTDGVAVVLNLASE